MTTRRIILTLIFVLAGQSVRAQDGGLEDVRRPIGVSPQVALFLGVPTGAFAKQVQTVGYGGAVAIFAHVGRTPLQLGVEVGGLVYGVERRREPFSTTIPDVTVSVHTTNNIGLGHVVVRLAPPAARVQPHIDALFGGKYLFTRTTIRSDHASDPVAASTNFDDGAWSYGAGAGLNVLLFEGMLGDRFGSVRMNLGVRYLFGSEAQYLKRGSIRRVDGKVEYDVLRSRTDVVIPQAGVLMRF